MIESRLRDDVTRELEAHEQHAITLVEDERAHSIRSWTLEELETFAGQFAPRRLPLLVCPLIQQGPLSEPIDVGV